MYINRVSIALIVTTNKWNSVESWLLYIVQEILNTHSCWPREVSLSIQRSWGSIFLMVRYYYWFGNSPFLGKPEELTKDNALSMSRLLELNWIKKSKKIKLFLYLRKIVSVQAWLSLSIRDQTILYLVTAMGSFIFALCYYYSLFSLKQIKCIIITLHCTPKNRVHLKL